MAEKKDDNPWTGTYEVVNTSKRSRTRNGIRFPGHVQGEEYEPVVVEVSGRAEWLRLKGCKDLQVKSTSKKAKATSGTGEGGQ